MMSLFSSFDISLWKLSFMMFFSFIFMFLFNSWFSSSSLVLKSSIQMELVSFFSSLNPKKMSKFSIPIFFGLVVMILLANFSSIFSFNFSLTSQVSMILLLSLSFWLSFILMFFSINYKGFIYHCVPEGTPLGLIPLLFLIELISNTIRPLTLMVRLVANILAGHLLMSLLGNFILSYYVFFPLLLVLNMVEFFVSLIQSYIFSTMIVLYYSELN